MSTDLDLESEPKLAALPEKEPIYITTPIYYVNAAPHIGHVYTTLIGDVYTRYYKLRGREVFYMTGTDEHGLKVEQSAKEKNLDTKTFTDQVSDLFKKQFADFGLKYDRFIRTTDEDHEVAVYEIWNRLWDKGYIYKGEYKGWYSVSDESFHTDLQVEEVVDSEGNKRVVCKETGNVVVRQIQENYKFKLSDFSDKLLEFYKANPRAVLPEFRQKEVMKFIEDGLIDLSVSREEFGWGISVPQDKTHSIYVWLDALTNYLTGSGFPKDEGKPRWPADIHLVGKDILRFHAVYWPAFLMAADLPLPRHVIAHGWWTKDKMKISKTKGNYFDVNEVAEKYGLDALRYFLMRENSLSDDGDYTDLAMRKRLNSDLADALGNLLLRCLSRKLNKDGMVPELGVLEDVDRAVVKKMQETVVLFDKFMLDFAWQKALEVVWELLSLLNKYVTDTEPWKLKKSDPERLGTVLHVMLQGIRFVGVMLLPVMPEKCSKLLTLIGCPKEIWKMDKLSFSIAEYSEGLHLSKEEKMILFVKSIEKKTTSKK